jgi:hypothetical protein
MPDQSNASVARRGSHILSTVLFIAAIGFAAAAVYIWYIDDAGDEEEPPVPSVDSGVYGLANVLEAFQQAGIDADYGRSPATANANQLDMPGQNLRVGDTNVYIFLFPGTEASPVAAARQSAFNDIDLATLTLTTRSGSDVTRGEPLTVYQGANVIAVLVGGDAELQDDIGDVIEGLR